MLIPSKRNILSHCNLYCTSWSPIVWGNLWWAFHGLQLRAATCDKSNGEFIRGMEELYSIAKVIWSHRFGTFYLLYCIRCKYIIVMYRFSYSSHYPTMYISHVIQIISTCHPNYFSLYRIPEIFNGAYQNLYNFHICCNWIHTSFPKFHSTIPKIANLIGKLEK